jgi:dsRNA-specific ribonuclease
MVQFQGQITAFIDSDAVVQVAYELFSFIHRTALNDMSFNSKRITEKTMCVLDVLCAILSNTGSEPASDFRVRQRERWHYRLQTIGPDATQFEPSPMVFDQWERLICAVKGGNNSIIVFCDMKLATTALDELFIKFWSTFDTVVPPCAFLHGGMSIETQKSILDRFKKGIIRVLFASEVAEEGIDIGKCRFVVHFDPPKTVKSQIQRRGRARAAQAQLIHIWPDVDTEEYGELLETFAKFHRDELKMSSVVQEFTAITREVARTLCGGSGGAGMRETVTSHGHTIDVISAQTLVIQYCQALHRRRRRNQREDDDDVSTTSFQPYYAFRRLSPSLFEARLHLPWDKMTHLTFDGRPELVIQATSKRLAQGLVAITAVRWLLSVGEIDELTLRPVMNPIARVAGVDLDVDMDEIDEDQGCEWTQKTVPDSLLPPTHLPMSGLRLYQYRIVVEKKEPLTGAADHQNDSDGDDSDGDGDGEEEGGDVDISAFMSKRQVPLVATAPPQQSHSKRRKGLQFLSSFEDIVILTAQEVLTRSDCDGIDGLLLTAGGDEQPRETSIGQDTAQRPQRIVRYEYLGERVVSHAELLWIQRFHTAIVQVDCLLPDIVGSDLCPIVRREEDGFFAVDSIRQERMRFDDDSINAYELLTHMWKNNGAWYWICPLAPVGGDRAQVERALMDAVLEAELLVKNCQWIQARNAQRSPVLDIVVDPVRPRADLVYTSTGNALFRYKSFVTSWSAEGGVQSALRETDVASLSTEQSSTATSVYSPSTLTRQFTDVMKVHGSQVITYARHYRRSDHQSRQRFLDAIERAQKAPNPFAATLFRGHSLSGKFTLHNYLQPPQGPQHEREPEEPLGLVADFVPPAEIIVPSSASSVSTLTASLPGGAPVAPQPPTPSSWNFFAPAFSLPVGHVKWYRLIMAVPSVMARFQSIVMAKEAQQRVFGAMAAACDRPAPHIKTVLTAITNTRAMENISNERLEFLGDSFLKYAATVYVLLSALLDGNPQLRDKPLTAEMMTDMRQSLLTNKTLSERMDALDILHYLRVIPICRGREQLELAMPDGRPGGTTHSGLRNVNIQASRSLVLTTVPAEAQQMATKTFSEGVPRKVRADFLEALLGAAVVATTSTASSEYDLALAWQAFLQLNLLSNTGVSAPPALSGFVQSKWLQLLAAAPWRAPYRTDEELIVRALRSILGYNWRDPALARLALTHPSAIAAMNVSASGCFPQHYDVLEFVGDAVLDFVVVQELFRRHPTWDESLLTTAKVALVNNHFLGTVATRCRLPSLIRHGDMEVFRETFTRALGNDDAADDVSALTESTHNLSVVDRHRHEQLSSPMRHLTRPPTSPLLPSAPRTPVTPDTAVEVFAPPDIEFSCSDKEMKIRADVFEALVGAVFVDSAGDLNTVQQVLRTMGYWQSVETYSQGA